jgi:hypothetical protein
MIIQESVLFLCLLQMITQTFYLKRKTKLYFTSCTVLGQTKINKLPK